MTSLPAERPLFRLLRRDPGRSRLVLFALVGVLAALIGFRVGSPPLLSRLVTGGGYYYILGVFAGFLLYAHRVAVSRRAVWAGWLRRPGAAGAVLLACAAFAVLSDSVKYKILFDEYVIQGTAYQMHATKEVGTTMRAYDIAGSWTSIDTFLDKRPYFYPFLVSLLHDLTGYRAANAFVLNGVLAAAVLGLTYWFGRALSGRGPALLSVVLLATLPLFGQNATGAGMDMHNLAMIALVACLCVLYLRAPDSDRLCLLVLTTVLLAQSRYESILFAAPVACIVVAGWVRLGRILLPWPVIGAPLLLVPYAWHNRVLLSMPEFWQFKDGRTSAFGLENVADNLRGAWAFLANTGPGEANSWCLSGLGLVACAWLLLRAWARLRARPALRPPLTAEDTVACVFAGGIAAHFAVLQCYWWARFDDLMASRFALPLCLAFAVAAGRWARALEDRGLPALRIAFGVAALWLVASGLPSMGKRYYTDDNLLAHELDWEHEVIAALPGPVLLITNKSPIPYALWRISAIYLDRAPFRTKAIRYHLKEGTFREVLVAQAIRPTSAAGDLGVDPHDVLPPSFHLRTLAEKRFGGRIARISQVVSIDPPPLPSPPPPARVTKPAAAGAPVAALSIR